MKKEIKILLGKRGSQEIYWEPSKEINPHMIMIGGSGSGKTETLKAVCLELKEKEIPSLIIDFHKDFDFLADTLIDINNSRIHPLEIQIGEKPIDVIYRFSRIVSNVFSNFGPLQEAMLRDAIKQFFIDSGIKNFKKPNEGQYEFMPFSHFEDNLKGLGNNINAKKIISKISMLFDFDIFNKANKTALPFDKITKSVTVMQLNEFPNDEIKSMVCELLMYKLINYCYIKGKQNQLGMYCVIDEAHRVTYEGSPIDLLLRESRKYGLGMLLASQRPIDFSENILANIGATLAFRCSLKKDATYISNSIGSSANELLSINKPGEGYYKFSIEKYSKEIQILPTSERSQYSEIIKQYNEEEARKVSELELKRIQIEQKKKEEFENALEDNKRLKSEKEKLSKSEDILKDKINDLKKNLFSADKEGKTLIEENKRLNQQNKKTNREISSMTVKLTNLEEKNKAINSEFNKIENQNKKLSQENTKLNRDISSMTRKISNLEEKNAKTMEDYQFYKKQAEKNLKSLQDNNKEISNINKQYKLQINRDTKEIENMNSQVLKEKKIVEKIKEKLLGDFRTKLFVKKMFDDFENLGDFIVCAECKSYNDPDKKFCTKCGKKL